MAFRAIETMSSILNNKIKTFYDRFISLKGEPKNIAMGLAVGIFIGVTPTIPFHTALIIFIGFIFRNNFTSAYLGSCSYPIPLPSLFFTYLNTNWAGLS